MLPTTKNLVLLLLGMSCSISLCHGDDNVVPQHLDPTPFGDEFPSLDGWATGQWWTKPSAQGDEVTQPAAGKKRNVDVRLFHFRLTHLVMRSLHLRSTQ